MNIQDAYPVIDGFVFASQQRCGLRFRDVVLEQFEALRRAGGFRSKTWLAPKDSSFQIPARDSFEYQLFLKPGSVIWGYTFVAVTGQQQAETPGTMSFNVRDGCDDIPLFSEVVTRQNQTTPYPQQYLSKLLIVGRPGLLNVEICNTFAAANTGQLVLWGGEPD